MASNKSFRRNKPVFSDELLKEDLNRFSREVRDKSKTSSRLERSSAIFANLSQVLTLVVIVWGYFYTVVPVFQKEKLTEDLARLKIEESRWKNEIERYKRNIYMTQGELSLLESEKNELESALDRIGSEKEQAEKSLERLSNREQRSKKKLQATSDALAEAERQLYEQQRMRLLGKTPVTMERIYLINNAGKDFNIFDRGSVSQVADRLSAAFVRPAEFVDKKIQNLEEQANAVSSKIYRDINLRLIDEFKEGIRRNASVLQCPEPNFEYWESEFEAALALGDEMVEDCIEFHFQVRAKKRDWSRGERASLKKSKYWDDHRRAYSGSCSLAIDYELSNIYRERWSHVNEPCEERLRKVSSIALESQSVLKLMPFRDMSPPSLSYVKSQVQASIDGWYKVKN